MKTLRRISLLLILSLLLTTLLPFCVSAQETAIPLLADLDQAETILYGNPNGTQAVVQRLNTMEKNLYGGVFPTSIPERVLQIKNVLTLNKQEVPSLVFQLRADEWVAQQKVSNGPLLLRLENLEKTLAGTNTQSPIVQKLQQINILCFRNGTIPMNPRTVSQGTLVKVEFLTPVSSDKSRVGDMVEFQVTDNVAIDGVLVIPAGSRATGQVTKVDSAKGFGKDGQLEIDFRTVEAFDGNPIRLILGEKAKQENKNMVYAAGASVTGAVLLGPIGLVGGAFVKGRQAQIPVGSKMFLEVKDSTPVMGLAVSGLPVVR